MACRKEQICAELCKKEINDPILGDRFFSADASRRSTGKKTSAGNNFLENAREFPEIITSVGAKFR